MVEWLRWNPEHRPSEAAGGEGEERASFENRGRSLPSLHMHISNQGYYCYCRPAATDGVVRGERREEIAGAGVVEESSFFAAAEGAENAVRNWLGRVWCGKRWCGQQAGKGGS